MFEGDTFDFGVDPSGGSVLAGEENGDFVGLGKTGGDPSLDDAGASGAFLRRIGERDDFGCGTFGQGLGAVEIREKVGGGWHIKSRKEGTKLAGVAHGVAKADIDRLPEELTEILGIEPSLAQGKALRGVMENSDGRVESPAKELKVYAPPAWVA